MNTVNDTAVVVILIGLFMLLPGWFFLSGVVVGLGLLMLVDHDG